MKIFFLMVITAIVAFVFYKGVLVLVSRILNKIFKISEKNQDKFDLGISITMQLLFLYIWVICMDVINKKYGLSNIVFYISFCLIGVFCVVWCYFSWDAEHILVKPRMASREHRKIKKVIIYLLILVFVLCQGYFKALHALDSTIEVSILFSVTDNTIVVAAIALDRVLNQICSE